MADRESAVREVRTTDEQVGDTNIRREAVVEKTSVPGSVVASRVVWYVVGFIIALLVIRIILQLLGANQENAFVNFIYNFSGIFAAPFFGMFSYQPTYGVSTFEVSTLVAILIYALVGWGVAKLLTVASNRQDV